MKITGLKILYFCEDGKDTFQYERHTETVLGNFEDLESALEYALNIHALTSEHNINYVKIIAIRRKKWRTVDYPPLTVLEGD